MASFYNCINSSTLISFVVFYDQNRISLLHSETTYSLVTLIKQLINNYQHMLTQIWDKLKITKFY
jgi:hypothetical protein